MTTLNLGRVVGRDGAPGQDGEDGEDGRGIVSITKTGTEGLVDTYTITYTDGTTSTYTVTNGSSGGGGTANYNELENKPSINNVSLQGNKSLSDLGAQPAGDYALSSEIPDISTKQDTLVSGTNIKTINNQSILGSGNITIEGGSGTVDTEMSDSSTNAVQNKVIKAYVDNAIGAKDDTLIGTLPQTVTQSGCYLLSSTNATIQVGAGGSGVFDFNDVNKYVVNSVCSYEVKTATSIRLKRESVSANLSLFLNQYTLLPNTTYTAFAKYTVVDGDWTRVKPYVRLKGGTIQISLTTTEFKYKPFTTDENGKISSPDGAISGNQIAIGAAKTASSTLNDTIDVELYIFQGDLTEMPQDRSFDIAANEKYSTDGFLGATLTSQSTVELWKDAKSNGGKGVIFFGDSIMDFSNIPNLYGERRNRSIIDCAVGGTRISASRDPQNEFYPYDMTQIAAAIGSGDFSSQISGGKNAQFSVLSTATITNYKAIVLEFCTNDFTAQVPFEGSATNTIEGAAKYIIETILAKYPTMRLVFLSTQPYVTLGSGDESGVPTHPDGTVWEMNEVLKSVCDSYGIPFIDMFHKFGENPITRDYLTADGVHLESSKGVPIYLDILTAQLDALGI